jgi:YfiH family protein
LLNPYLRAGWCWTVDAHATRQPGVLLTVTVADCVPVYLAAPESGLVALLHAGWRGIADGILEQTITAIGAVADVRHSYIIMHCGVSICGNCYEVGSEVAERLSGRPESTPSHLDLRSILAARAATLGVGAVTVSAYCTAHHNDRFYSHRASKGRDGRLVAYLGRPRSPLGLA